MMMMMMRRVFIKRERERDRERGKGKGRWTGGELKKVGKKGGKRGEKKKHRERERESERSLAYIVTQRPVWLLCGTTAAGAISSSLRTVPGAQSPQPLKSWILIVSS